MGFINRLMCVLRRVVKRCFTTIVSWMRFDRLLVLLWFGFRHLFVCGGKLSLAMGWLYLRMAWSLARAASSLVSKVPRDILLSFIPSRASYISHTLTPSQFFLPFGSLLRLCFMVGKFNCDFGRQCLWTAWSYAMWQLACVCWRGQGMWLCL